MAANNGWNLNAGRLSMQQGGPIGEETPLMKGQAGPGPAAPAEEDPFAAPAAGNGAEDGFNAGPDLEANDNGPPPYTDQQPPQQQPQQRRPGQPPRPGGGQGQQKHHGRNCLIS